MNRLGLINLAGGWRRSGVGTRKVLLFPMTLFTKPGLIDRLQRNLQYLVTGGATEIVRFLVHFPGLAVSISLAQSAVNEVYPI